MRHTALNDLAASVLGAYLPMVVFVEYPAGGGMGNGRCYAVFVFYFMLAVRILKYLTACTDIILAVSALGRACGLGGHMSQVMRQCKCLTLLVGAYRTSTLSFAGFVARRKLRYRPAAERVKRVVYGVVASVCFTYLLVAVTVENVIDINVRMSCTGMIYIPMLSPFVA